MPEKLSIQTVFIIPFYNEENRLPIKEWEKGFRDFPQVDFLLIDDDSSDQTYSLLKTWYESFSNISLLKNESNLGKAASIRKAILQLPENKYGCIAYLDADLATPITELVRLCEIFEDQPGLKMLMGTRIKLMGNQVHRSLLRHYFGRVFATIISQWVLKFPVYDTQCGAKVIEFQLAKELFQDPFSTRWLFDVELLLRLKKKKPQLLKSVVEIPLNAWEEKGESKIKLNEFISFPFQILKIYARYR